MISTRDLSRLPDLDGFGRVTRSLAMLDAILSPEWQYRYYSFNSRWADGQMMASMQNGCGDLWFALLTSHGVALHGVSHESPTFRPGLPRPEIFADLPSEFHIHFLREPAFDTTNSTFCIWRRADDVRWSCGVRQSTDGNDDDGSAELLSILEGKPEQYVTFAAEYYERDIQLADVASIYRHLPLTTALLRRLNPDVTIDSLAADIEEIGYPDAG